MASRGTSGRGRRRAVFWLSFLVVLFALVAIADRVGALVAEHAAASKLAGYAQFASRPSVDVHGVPFLTQAISGKYDNIEVTSDAVRVGDVSGAGLDVNLRGAHVPLSDLVGGHVEQLPVDRVDGDVTIPYAQLARLAKVSGLTITPAGSAVQITAPMAVPGIDGTVRVSGQAALALVGSSVRLTVSEVSVAGVSLPDGLVRRLAGNLSATIPLPTLPYGLRLDSIAVRHDGLALAGSGTDVVLHAQ